MIFIVCALHCEARPLIEKYRLSADREAFYPVFHGKDITLVVTGIGKLLTAAAMSYVFARYKEPAEAGWLNVGVAGMKDAEIGQLFNINKVTEKSSDTNWYPVRLPGLPSNASCALTTVDEPCEQYETGMAFDMEASAFMLTALRFSTVEFVQLLKIISDTENHALENINKSFVTDIVRQNLNQIDEVVNQFRINLAAIEDDTFEKQLYSQCLGAWHFSEYQKKSLRRMLQQWLALNEDADMAELSSFNSAKQVLAFLTQVLNDSEIEFLSAK